MGTFCRLHEKKIRNDFSFLFLFYFVIFFFFIVFKTKRPTNVVCDLYSSGKCKPYTFVILDKPFTNLFGMTVLVIAPWHHWIPFHLRNKKKTETKAIFHIWRALLPHSLFDYLNRSNFIAIIPSFKHPTVQMFAMCTFPRYCIFCFLWANYFLF